MCWHPKRKNQFASVSDGFWLFVWDAEKKKLLMAGDMGFPLRSISFSIDPLEGQSSHHIAVGGTKGRIKVGNKLSQFIPKISIPCVC